MDLQKKAVQSIIRTVAWFDIFDQPATAEEIYKYIWDFPYDIDYHQFLVFLRTLVHDEILEKEQGYYYFTDRSGLVEKRNVRAGLVEEKIQIATKAVQKIYWVPFVRSVYLCNTVAFGWPKESSDVDVFIVVKKDRMWLARFLVTLRLAIAGMRRNKKKSKNKICLSFYTTDENLGLESISIQDDIYMVYWIRHLFPLYDPDNVLVSILNANKWIQKYINLDVKQMTIPRYRVRTKRFGSYMKRKFERVWDGTYGKMLEEQARRIQKQKMKMNTDSIQNEKDTRVIISDEMLKFHENDRRALYKQMWKDRYKTVIEKL